MIVYKYLKIFSLFFSILLEHSVLGSHVTNVTLIYSANIYVFDFKKIYEYLFCTIIILYCYTEVTN